MSTTPRTEQRTPTPPAVGAGVVEITDEALAAADAAHYSMTIEWSDEDGLYIVSLPEWGPFAQTHGATYAEAAAMGREALALLILGARHDGTSPPAPRLFGRDAR